MSGSRADLWFEKQLSINDTPRRRGHQNALVIPVGAARRMYPHLEAGRPAAVKVVDPARRVWNLGVRLYAKGEYHLAGSDPLLEAFGLEPGDLVRFHARPGGGYDFSFDRTSIDVVARRLTAAGSTIEDDLVAEELADPDQYSEGARTTITVNAYERDAKLRAACIARKGAVCAACGLDFGRKYGEVGRGFIHVHHTIPASKLADVGGFDPNEHLVPVCPNCHAMLHRGRGDEPRTIEDLQVLLRDVPASEES